MRIHCPGRTFWKYSPSFSSSTLKSEFIKKKPDRAGIQTDGGADIQTQGGAGIQTDGGAGIYRNENIQ